MDELVDQVVGNVSIARPVAERAVGIILDFLATDGPADTLKATRRRLRTLKAADWLASWALEAG